MDYSLYHIFPHCLFVFLFKLNVCFDLLLLGVRSFLLGRFCLQMVAVGRVSTQIGLAAMPSVLSFVFENAQCTAVEKSLWKYTVEKSGVHSDRTCCQPAYCHLTDHTPNLHLIQHHRYNHTKGPTRKKFYQEICLHKNLVGQVWVSYAQSAINSSSTLCACAVENPFSGILRNQETKLVCPLWPTDYRVTDPA